MGNGSNTTTTNQASTYQPSPQAAGYINTALQNAQTAAQAPFQQPVAPVAGFSPDQLAAFQTVNNAQGMANPYFTQASQLFGQSAQAPNVNQFFNPLAGQVGAQLQNLFGQQMSQTTGQLTQAAGGVGADRIAVGQGQLANQQGLAAGQTFAGLYQPALQAAQQEQNILQGAAYGYGALGPAAQNAVLSGAQAQLGTGGLQQQLSQAQLNAPYQQKLAQLAYPFQTSNFLSNAVGSLAPGLGGTTWGGGQTTLPAPSMLSQIGGLGLAGVGLVGGTGGFGSNGWLTNAFSGATGFAEGGAPEVSEEPVDIEPHGGVVSQGQIAKISPHIPQINLTPPQQSSGGKGSMGNILGDIGSIAKIGAMFANRGGTVGMGNPMFAEGYADGGSPMDTADWPNGPFGAPLDTGPEYQQGLDMLHGPMDAAMLRGPMTDYTRQAGTDMLREEMTNPTRQQGLDMLRNAMLGNSSVPTPRERPTDAPMADTSGMPVFDENGRMLGNMTSNQGQQPTANNTDDQPVAAFAGPSVAQDAPRIRGLNAPVPSPVASPAASQPEAAPSKHGQGLANSQWLPLIAAGLGMAAGNSPFALQNIGQGGLTGLKVLEAQQQAEQKQQTIDQAAEKLRQEVKEHEDEYTRQKPATPYQQYEMTKPVPMGQTIGPLGLPMTTYGLPDGKGGFKPIQAPTPQDGSAPNPVKDISKGIKSGLTPPDTTGLGRLAPVVKADLARDGFNLQQAQLEAAAAKKQILSLNGPQMVRYTGLAKGVDQTIDRVRELSQQMEQSGVPLLNQLELQKFIQTEGNSPKGQLATAYQTQVGILKEEFANLANGGYAPTEPAWALANQQINGNYGVKQLGASLDEVQRAIRYRLHNIPNMDTLGPGSQNRYIPGGQQQPAAAPSAAVDPLAEARAAIQKGVPREKVIQRLQEHGINPAGL